MFGMVSNTRLAKIGRGWAEASGPVAFNLKDSQTHFAKLRMT
jgi:hypothetical protein